MKYLSPAKTITPAESDSLEEIYGRLLSRVGELRGFKPYATSDKFPHAVAFSKGSPLIDFVDDWIPIWRYESYYFILLEKDPEHNRIILTLQNLSYRKTDEDLDTYLALFRGLSNVEISEWFEAATLPRELLSHPLTFMKSRGLAGWLF